MSHSALYSLALKSSATTIASRIISRSSSKGPLYFAYTSFVKFKVLDSTLCINVWTNLSILDAIDQMVGVLWIVRNIRHL